MSPAYIIDALRTPRGRGKAGRGALSGVHPQELLAQTLTALATRTGIDPHAVDDVMVSVVSQVGEQGANIARNALLAANWPYEISAISIDRFCGSGLSAVQFASMGVASGAQDLVVAGGVESMSRVPMGSDGSGGDGNNPHLRERYFQVPQGIAADLIATLDGAERSKVDRFALRSQERAALAIAENRFARSLVPVLDPETQAIVLAKDELPRPTTLAGLGELSGVFRRARLDRRGRARSHARPRSRSPAIRVLAPSTTCTRRATRVASRMAPPLYCWPRRRTSKATPCGHARASGRSRTWVANRC